MTTFYISDLHLGDRGPRDNFLANEQAFYRFLDWVQQDPKNELTILGDLFDWWQCNPSRTMLAYKPLLDRMNTVGRYGPLWIIGNHDNALVGFAGRRIGIDAIRLPIMIEATVIWRYDRLLSPRDVYDVLLCHGHEADPYCRGDNPSIGEATAILSGMREDRKEEQDPNGATEDTFIGRLEWPLDMWNKIRGMPSRLNEMVNQVEAMRKDRRATAVIYGHTHEAGQIGKHHFNCGCWCRTRNTFVKQDADGITVHEWTGDEAIPFERHLLG